MVTSRPRNPWRGRGAETQVRPCALCATTLCPPRLPPGPHRMCRRNLGAARPAPRRSLPHPTRGAAAPPQRRPAARNISVVPTTGRPLPRSSGWRQTRQWQRGGCDDSFRYGAIREQPSCDIVAQGRPPQPGTRGHAARADLTARANDRMPRATSPRQPAVRAGSDTRTTTRT